MSDKLPRVDCQQLIRALKNAGFEEQRQRGSHLHLRRASDNKRVTVPVHTNCAGWHLAAFSAMRTLH